MSNNFVHAYSSHGVILHIFVIPLLLSTLLSVANGTDDMTGHLSLLQVHAQPVAHEGTELIVSETTLSFDSSSTNSLILHIPYHHIALNLTYHNLGEQILTFPQRRPREFNAILATLKTWLADLIVQFLERQRKGDSWTFDYRRSFAFALFGFIYIGLVQWLLYVTILTWLFPHALTFANAPLSIKMNDGAGQWDMLGQVMVDNFIFEVMVYFPAFYVIKSLVQLGGSIPERVKTGLGMYQANFFKDNMVSWALWIPADLFIFACPMYLRMPLEHSFSFGWTMFISFRRGAADSEKEDKDFCH
jgi:hypothetical protein